MKPTKVQLQYRLIHDVYVLMDYGDSAILNQYELTASQMSVLRQLDSEQGCRLTTLSERVMRSKSAITRMIDNLEEKALVSRVGDAEDRRAQRVVLTRAGEKYREKVNQKHLESLDRRFEILSTQEQEQLTMLLNKLRLGLTEQMQAK